MSVTTGDILGSASWNDEADHEWLHLLVGDWQLLADLSFSDLTLWVATDGGWRAAAQVRPTTGVSLFAEDLLGSAPAAELAQRLELTLRGGARLSASHEQAGDEGEAVQIDTLPVRRLGTVIAVLSRHMRLANVRRRGRLETKYLALAENLMTMIAEGSFPDGGGASSGRGGAPRVGDGVVALDEFGHVTYASPNAVSALRRLGIESNLVGLHLAGVLTELGTTTADAPEEASVVLTGRAPWHTELRHGSAAVMVRCVPLIDAGRRLGAALLLRDITELRRRDRELISKDATIREIHHRVKNNLQTVAAVLRLQARRVSDDAGRQALADAGRRVAVIAAVHESLSAGFADAVDFDEVAGRGLASAIEVARGSEADVVGRLEGSFGRLASEDATPLAMILGELVQNAVEHGLAGAGGQVVVRARREGDDLEVHVIDDGVGLGGARPERGRRRGGLGTQIVETFVDDLHGSIEWRPAAGGGTEAVFTATLRAPEPGTDSGRARSS